ncbi:MAG: group III truncated hemoglobin [Bacteroidetes bacterium]|nr:group III truncated hemoglobin [Bacteroidota bacterium]MBU1484606.1 group III truncated hemoglobin [Bacteroidota bacterium]MBU1759514.1 group III truncated hemoglobin [Bacteroidota bacterium]MBU2045728.1 group III truncated hemoglobin [Bacteroidota bacterium]MBU2269064.1 group III truncated hemoglobin [Bacteroidota bacterium]
MKKDIQNADDIKLLVDEFYKKAVEDKDLGHIFTDVAKVNWGHHLPIMYAFWESTLLGTPGYKGNPMDAHFKLNQKIELTGEHFSRWKSLFIQTVEENFVGEIAELAKDKAVSIADLMFYKIHNYYNSPGLAKRKDN